MNWKNRITNYSFWVSLISAVLLICKAFKLEFDIVNLNEIATAVLGLLVVVGIISDPTKTQTKKTEVETKNNKVENVVSDNSVNENKDNLEIPSETKNEDVDDNSKNDLQVLIDKISCDIKDEIEKKEFIAKDLVNSLKSKFNFLNEDELKGENVNLDNVYNEVIKDEGNSVVENAINEAVKVENQEQINAETTEQINLETAEVVENNEVVEETTEIVENEIKDVENDVEEVVDKVEENENKVDAKNVEPADMEIKQAPITFNIVNN